MDKKTEKQIVGIPESITINGVVYTISDTPELQVFAQQVAKVEKTKLYSQYENLKSKIEGLQKVQVTPEQTSNESIKELITEMTKSFVTKEDLQTSITASMKEVMEPVLNATRENKEQEIANYRQSLIDANTDKCIPELVRGNSKAELDASLAESIRLRGAYPSPSTAAIPNGGNKTVDPLIQRQMEEANNQKREMERAAIPTAPRMETAFEEQAPSGVKAMPMSQFAQEREALMANLEATYGN